MGECNNVSTPPTKGGMDSDNTSIVLSVVPYNNMISSLQYAVITTRPGINMALPHLIRVLAQASTNHWEAGKRVLRYLKGTINVGLVLGVHDSCKLT